MQNSPAVLKGTVHGNTIEFEGELDIPDGQEVTVIVQPAPLADDTLKRLPPGEGIRRSAGAWSDDPEGLDQFLQSVYERRRATQRRPIEP
jgi:hypothetical protein